MLMLLLACVRPFDASDSSAPSDSSASSESLDSAADGPEDCTTEELGDGGEFFDVNTIREVRITLPESAFEELDDDPKIYVEGDVVIDGTPFLHVGVRLKGHSSFEDFDGKPALKIKLNEYCVGQKYAGLKRITLNNMTSDPTQSQEILNYQLWSLAGLFGPRVSYAQVFVNEELYGLYANVESVDDEWLERTYSDPTGQLWEAADTAEFDDAGLVGWEMKSGLDDPSTLAAVAAAIAAPGDVYTNLNTVIDMEQFLSYWAWKAIIGDSDGYPWHLNDVFLYGDPELGGRFQFSPWGMDEAWKDYVNWDDADGLLATVCLAEPACNARIHDRTEEALAAFEAMDPVGLISAAWALSEPVLVDDPRRSYTVAEVEAAREELAVEIAERAEDVRDDL